MPLRAYEPVSPPCRLCGAGFDILQPAAEPPLTLCPTCGRRIRLRAAIAVNSPRVSRPASLSEAKAAGFAVLKRTSAGEYEKL